MTNEDIGVDDSRYPSRHHEPEYDENSMILFASAFEAFDPHPILSLFLKGF